MRPSGENLTFPDRLLPLRRHTNSHYPVPSDAAGQGNGIAAAMLSIEQLKQTDPKLQGLSDSEIAAIRSKLYALAELTLDCWTKATRPTPSAPPELEHDDGLGNHDKLSP